MMRIRTIRYERLFALKQYENFKFCLEADIEHGEKAADAMIGLIHIARQAAIHHKELEEIELDFLSSYAKLGKPEKVKRLKELQSNQDRLTREYDAAGDAGIKQRIVDEMQNNTKAIEKVCCELEQLSDTTIKLMEAKEKKIAEVKESLDAEIILAGL